MTKSDPKLFPGFKKHAFECYFSPITMRQWWTEYDPAWIEAVMSANARYADHINLRYALKCLESIGYDNMFMSSRKWLIFSRL